MSSLSAGLLVIGLITIGSYFSIKYFVLDGESYWTFFKAILPQWKSSKSKVRVVEDPDFGTIRFVEPISEKDVGYWQMDGKWKDTGLSSASIPGSVDGPYDNAREFILNKFTTASSLWGLLGDSLREAAELLIPQVKSLDLKDIFVISCINTDPITDSGDQEWEVCFETREGIKWVYIGLQIQNDEVTSNTIDT